MPLAVKTKNWGGVLLAVSLLALAIWFLMPFLKIDSSDYKSADSSLYRLAAGLMILILYIGKWFFDVLSPQGSGRRVSNLKSVLLIILSIVVLVFIIYVIVQAGSLYLGSAAQQDANELIY